MTSTFELCLTGPFICMQNRQLPPKKVLTKGYNYAEKENSLILIGVMLLFLTSWFPKEARLLQCLWNVKVRLPCLDWRNCFFITPTSLWTWLSPELPKAWNYISGNCFGMLQLTAHVPSMRWHTFSSFHQISKIFMLSHSQFSLYCIPTPSGVSHVSGSRENKAGMFKHGNGAPVALGLLVNFSPSPGVNSIWVKEDGPKQLKGFPHPIYLRTLTVLSAGEPPSPEKSGYSFFIPPRLLTAGWRWPGCQ